MPPSGARGEARAAAGAADPETAIAHELNVEPAIGELLEEAAATP